jgi:predicted HTH transcriptional regulator
MVDLANLLNQQEGKTLEFKRDASSPVPLMKTLVAFANGSGGILLIGVEDQSRHILGAPEPTRLEGQLASWIVDRIEPRLVPEILIVPWRNKNLVLVEVFPSPLRPHYLKAEGEANGVYVRIGSTNRRADPAQVAELKRQVLGRSFDEDPLPERHSEDLDFQAASEAFAAKRKLAAGDLKTLNLLVRYQNRLVPTIGGMLLFGKERLVVFPDARIRVAVFAGQDRTQILDTQEITSFLPTAVGEVIAFVQRNTRRAILFSGIRNEGVPEIPLIALREAVINAVVHADYGQHGSPLRVAVFSDRLEIENPGGLPPGLTLDEVRQGASKLRNRVIGRVFHELGLIEQWGSGIQRMTKACLDAGLPEPVLEEIGSGFRVTFGFIPIQKASLDLLDQKILDLLAADPTGISNGQLAKAIERSTRATRDRVKRLMELGLIREHGSSSRDPKKVFRLAVPS